jgi:LuxR family transcriptional regulator, maltose regulon positive regulatory protein
VSTPAPARAALAGSDHHAALEPLEDATAGRSDPASSAGAQILLVAAAVERGDQAAAGIVGGVLEAARHEGFFNAVLTTALKMPSPSAVGR